MTQIAKHAPELLAPAGGPSALRAAVANGADAVYLGVEAFNARRGAENFTLETLADACSFAHVRGVRVYLTVNVLVLPREMPEALDLIDRAWAAGVDAVIVQDIGLLRVVRQVLPQVRVHSSTQMNAHSSATLEALAGRGVRRVTLAREVSIDEIAALAQAGARVGVEVESFGHGALCMCYSGQCLMSSLVGGRSANRGMCAQPCRLPYELVDDSGRVFETAGPHLLSPKDLASITVLPRLLATGVSAIKIEGRMKSAEYVALVTGVYRAALDRAMGQPDDFEVRDGEMSVLSEAFSRGFTEAYLLGERGNDMMSYLRPNNRGVPVGRITKVAEGEATLQLDISLEEADTIEVWTGRGRFAQPVGPMTVDGRTVSSAAAGMRVKIRLAENASTGDRVFRVRNAALMDAAERSYADIDTAAPIELKADVELALGQPAKITFTDDAGREGSAAGSVVERARTKAVSADDVIEHVGRLGGTPYRVSDWSVTLSPGVGIGFSELHRVRREALAALERTVLAPWADRAPVRPTLPDLAASRNARATSARAGSRLRLVASASTLDVARACLQAGADRVHVPASELASVSDDPPAGEVTPPAAFSATDGIVPVLPRIDHDSEVQHARSVAERFGQVVAGTLGELAWAGPERQVEAHWSLNAFNAFAVAELADLGADLVWLSPELSGPQLADVASRAAVPVGLGIWGRQEVMVTEHCVLMSRGECNRRCESCARRTGTHFLKDRKGYRFPVVTDATGRSHVYNSVPLDLTEALPELIVAGITEFRVDVDTLGPAQAAHAIAAVRSALHAAGTGRIPAERAAGTTTGHYFRGVS